MAMLLEQYVMLRQRLRDIVPPLSRSLSKGAAGRVAVLGGSVEYTGAPYFSAMAALRQGADLAHIYCDADAAVAIKSYSPDLIVHPLHKAAAAATDGAEAQVVAALERLRPQLPRLDALVIGPGLGRAELPQLVAARVIEECRRLHVPLVIDGDGLFLVSHEPQLVADYPLAVLTPNVTEMRYLRKAAAARMQRNGGDASSASASTSTSTAGSSSSSSSNDGENLTTAEVATALGNVTIVEKARVDKISNGIHSASWCYDSSPRRCGGQGDLLSGSIAVFLAWALSAQKTAAIEAAAAMPLQPSEATVTAALAGCAVTRMASVRAWIHHRRATVAQDMLAEIGPVFEQLFPEDDSWRRETNKREKKADE